MSSCLRILIDCSQLSKTYYNVLFDSSTQDHHARHVGGRFRRTKITRKDRDVAENLQLYSGCSVLPPEIVMHDDAYIGGRSENNTECVVTTISGERTKQLDIFCNVTGFTSYFLSFIVVELIWFFHGAIQLYLST